MPPRRPMAAPGLCRQTPRSPSAGTVWRSSPTRRVWEPISSTGRSAGAARWPRSSRSARRATPAATRWAAGRTMRSRRWRATRSRIVRSPDRAAVACAARSARASARSRKQGAPPRPAVRVHRRLPCRLRRISGHRAVQRPGPGVLRQHALVPALLRGRGVRQRCKRAGRVPEHRGDVAGVRRSLSSITRAARPRISLPGRNDSADAPAAAGRCCGRRARGRSSRWPSRRTSRACRA